jgi:hypothetical protein
MTSWRDAFDRQVDLFTWWSGSKATMFAEGYMRSVSRTGNGSRIAAEGLVRGQKYTMLHADPIAVDDDMFALVDNAAKTFPPEALREEDLLTPVGFVWLPRPFTMIDVHDKRMSCRAIGWTPAPFRSVGPDGLPRSDSDSPGIMLSFYSLRGDDDDFGELMDKFADFYQTDLSMAHWEPWLFGESYEVMAYKAGGAREGLRFVQALWRLMQQTITETHQHRPERATRRRAARADMPERYVTVIRLRRPRRPQGDDHEPKAVEWTHRWLVEGHWRQQWYPSLSTHRSIWISPYVKGPDDKPLQMRRLRAFEFKQ